MTKERKREIACMMLVSLASDGQDIRELAKRLTTSFTFGEMWSFDAVCRDIGALYKGSVK